MRRCTCDALAMRAFEVMCCECNYVCACVRMVEVCSTATVFVVSGGGEGAAKACKARARADADKAHACIILLVTEVGKKDASP